MRRAILTGGTGFFGHWLLKELLKHEIEVIVVSRKNSKKNIKELKLPNVKFLEIGMENIISIEKYVSSADVFYHLAWHGDRDNYKEQLLNIEWAVNSMLISKKLGIKHFIGVGSQAEYGIVKGIISEETPTNPNTAYGLCKLCTYNILNDMANTLDIKFTWTRIFSLYGEGDNQNTLISYLVNCFNSKLTPQLSSGEHYWDYLHAEDAARAMYLIGKNEVIGLYNVAYGESMKIKDFVCEVRNIISSNSNIIFNPNDIRDIELKVDINKIKKDLDWKPNVDFKSGAYRLKD